MTKTYDAIFVNECDMNFNVFNSFFIAFNEVHTAQRINKESARVFWMKNVKACSDRHPNGLIDFYLKEKVRTGLGLICFNWLCKNLKLFPIWTLLSCRNVRFSCSRHLLSYSTPLRWYWTFKTNEYFWNSYSWWDGKLKTIADEILRIDIKFISNINNE